MTVIVFGKKSDKELQSWQQGWLECAAYVRERVESGDIILSVMADLEAIAATADESRSRSREGLGGKRSLS